MTEVTAAAAPATETPPTDTTPPITETPPESGVSASAPPPADVLTPPGEGTPPPEGWGNDWRQKYAGEDEKLLKRLERYASPKAALDALLDAQRKISAGDFKKTLPENATEEQVAAWRKENGLPAKASDYFENLPDGLVLGDDDRALFESFGEEMLGLNVEPAVMHKIVDWYNGFAEKQIEGLQSREQESLASTQATLREEWGGDYTANLNLINSMLASAPAGIKDGILSARLPDGTPLLNSPEMMGWMAQQARELNPAGALVPGSTGTSGAGLEDEIASIEKVMQSNRRTYLKDEKMQARYRSLIDARAKMAARAV